MNFEWRKFVYSENRGRQFSVNVKGDAVPTLVGAGSVETHETSYSPVPDNKRNNQSNFIEFQEFVGLVMRESSIRVLVHYETVKGSKGASECVISVDEAFRKHIENGWIGPGCVK